MPKQSLVIRFDGFVKKKDWYSSDMRKEVGG